MQSKKFYVILGITILVVGVAVIIAGGRRSGDRISAEVLLYSNPQSIKSPGF